MAAKTIQLEQTKSELISDEVTEIMSYRPHWIVRYGNAIFFLVLVSLLSLTWFISYPDMINGSVKLVALNPPKQVNAKVEGKLLKLLVINEQTVYKGMPLGYMESTANYNEILRLQQWIDQTILTTKNNSYTILLTHPLPELNNLGELQNAYQLFQNELVETRQMLASGYYQQKRASLQKDLRYYPH